MLAVILPIYAYFERKVLRMNSNDCNCLLDLFWKYSPDVVVCCQACIDADFRNTWSTADVIRVSFCLPPVAIVWNSDTSKHGVFYDKHDYFVTISVASFSPEVEILYFVDIDATFMNWTCCSSCDCDCWGRWRLDYYKHTRFFTWRLYELITKWTSTQTVEMNICNIPTEECAVGVSNCYKQLY